MNEQINKKITAELQKRYPDAGIKGVVVDESSGKSTFYVDPGNKSLAFLDDSVKARPHRDSASVITRDAITRSTLDLMPDTDVYDADPKDLYEKALRYYYVDPIVGSALNFLSSVTTKGFENDIDDPNIKAFYDAWVLDVNFEEMLDWIALDLYRVSNVTTYKYLAKYEPRVSNLPNSKNIKQKRASGRTKDVAAKKYVWSKGFLPVGYTVLNPLLVSIEGNLLFNQVSVKLTPPEELKELLEKSASELTVEEKKLIKALPSALKSAIKNDEDYALDPSLVSTITYKKMPYERYARPRIARVFDSLDYKKALREADISTVDGVSNYILKITVGNDNYPVTGQEELEAVAKLFDTPSKSFDVVWNHTLEVEKIVSPEIESILGQDKYKQVNDDITGGLSLTRALIDGTGGLNEAEVAWAVRGIREDIEYVRRIIERWVYREYRQIAEAMKFDKFPKIRWDEGVLKDEILYKNIIGQMVDRRMLSYQTALEAVGFDYANELSNMQQELPLVEEGIFGIIGSPFQRSGKIDLQDKQAAPKGTPSNGRPKGQTNTKTKQTDPNKLQDNKVGASNEASPLDEVLRKMSVDDLKLLIEKATEISNENKQDRV